ncbi:hypothetical protein [Ideonella sp. YS5]|uniref:hypothetical protein n=1 Tax=Ideonella sp. YS5 TaxID=3453714 RepID=UPI003EEF6507
MKKLFTQGAAAALALLMAACGGGSDRPGGDDGDRKPATTLAYTDPTGTGWRLVRQEGSTDQRIVLGLVGPGDTTSRGVGFNLGLGRGVHFGTFADGAYAHDTGVFKLKGSNPDFEPYAGTDADPVLFASRLKGDKLLTTGIFQKDRTHGAKPLDKPVVQVVVELDEATSLLRGTKVALAVVKARTIPDDIGGRNFQVDLETLEKAKMVDIPIQVGTLTAQ